MKDRGASPALKHTNRNRDVRKSHNLPAWLGLHSQLSLGVSRVDYRGHEVLELYQDLIAIAIEEMHVAQVEPELLLDSKL